MIELFQVRTELGVFHIHDKGIVTFECANENFDGLRTDLFTPLLVLEGGPIVCIALFTQYVS